LEVHVTGGAGYIGCHRCFELLEMEYEVFVLDNLSNGYEEALKRSKNITKCENLNGIPKNLILCISQVASGQREFLRIFGSDYETRDGTGFRDHIQIKDLSNAHFKMLHCQSKI
jgi:UDP-glucose 4-epimerase